ncbi:MAG: Sec-independent protein translocase subunit TatA/TatB [Planctomycetota bacterium]
MTMLAFGLPGYWEWAVLLVIGLLLFGKRLPDVGRSLGRSIVEFKKGIKGIEDDIDSAVNDRNPELEDKARDSSASSSSSSSSSSTNSTGSGSSGTQGPSPRLNNAEGSG